MANPCRWLWIPRAASGRHLAHLPWEPLKKMDDRLRSCLMRTATAPDKAITFAKATTGFEFWNAASSGRGDILFQGHRRDDVADVRIRLFHGLDSADTTTCNAFVYGPDGNFYYQHGVFHVSNVETPWTKNQQHGNSAMYRFNPRTSIQLTPTTAPTRTVSASTTGVTTSPPTAPAVRLSVRPDGRGFRMQAVLNKTVRPVPANGVISATFPDKYQGNFLILNPSASSASSSTRWSTPLRARTAMATASATSMKPLRNLIPTTPTRNPAVPSAIFGVWIRKTCCSHRRSLPPHRFRDR